MRDRLRGKLFGTEVPVRRVGSYALVKQLGEGGQGSVWAAYDETLDRRVAIKLLPALEGEEREQAEARLLRKHGRWRGWGTRMWCRSSRRGSLKTASTWRWSS